MRHSSAAADPIVQPGIRALHAEQRTWLNGLFAACSDCKKASRHCRATKWQSSCLA